MVFFRNYNHIRRKLTSLDFSIEWLCIDQCTIHIKDDGFNHYLTGF